MKAATKSATAGGCARLIDTFNTGAAALPSFVDAYYVPLEAGGKLHRASFISRTVAERAIRA